MCECVLVRVYTGADNLFTGQDNIDNTHTHMHTLLKGIESVHTYKHGTTVAPKILFPLEKCPGAIHKTSVGSRKEYLEVGLAIMSAPSCYGE